MFDPYIRSADILGDSKPDVENILKHNNQVILSENGKSTAVIIGIQEYEALKDALYDRLVLQKLAEAEAIEDNPEAWGSEEELLQVLRA
jgi:PHD/YefM family antitoxin component YafN of YafNO toxin-antitoxin module